ncbi:MAG: HAMP domain-containing histidine kinase [Pontiellaceae bacterium]|nr:HAMP domain-containing histidine kinase [Pontiellaceae bacterium]MBN2784089.1 HAMP domain-containing histidine kinase [Pontiellaceae bacterium]
MQLDVAGLDRMRRMLRHRLLNFVSGVKSANVLLASELEDRLAPREREYFSMIQKECDLITFMTERLESLFAVLPAPAPARLEDAIMTIMTDVRGVHPMADIALELDPACTGHELKVCSSALRTALMESVSNAYEFSRKPVSISIADSDQACRIQVLDEGRPMTDEVIAMAFEPFYSTRPRHVGVGLSIAKRYVEDRSGAMTISSCEDGNCTAFVLPYM